MATLDERNSIDNLNDTIHEFQDKVLSALSGFGERVASLETNVRNLWHDMEKFAGVSARLQELESWRANIKERESDRKWVIGLAVTAIVACITSVVTALFK